MHAEGSSSDVPPAEVGRYRVLHQIGAGSVGPVFHGEDPTSGHSVAIHLLHLSTLTPEQARALAEGLGELGSRVPGHPALAPILEAGVQDGEPYYVTPFVTGDPLDIALQKYGPAAMDDALPRLRLLADGLDTAAAAGFCHGALQLSDIFVSADETAIAGVGVRQVLVEAGAIDRASAVADQSALAAIAYEWIYGRPAPVADKTVEVRELPGVDGDRSIAGARSERRFSAAALAIALAAGIGIGMLAGSRLASPRAGAIEPLTARLGQQYTDSTLPKPVADAAPASARAESAATFGGASPGAPTAAGSLVVLSRPAGARVMIDGRAAGSTPLTVSSVSAGTHTVRINRPGYRPWVTTVRIEEGARARVAASLVGGRAQE